MLLVSFHYRDSHPTSKSAPPIATGCQSAGREVAYCTVNVEVHASRDFVVSLFCPGCGYLLQLL